MDSDVFSNVLMGSIPSHTDLALLTHLHLPRFESYRGSQYLQRRHAAAASVDSF